MRSIHTEPRSSCVKRYRFDRDLDPVPRIHQSPRKPSRRIGFTSQTSLKPNIQPISADKLGAPVTKWLVETSTDSHVTATAARMVPDVGWPVQLCVSPAYVQLRNTLGILPAYRKHLRDMATCTLGTGTRSRLRQSAGALVVHRGYLERGWSDALTPKFDPELPVFDWKPSPLVLDTSRFHIYCCFYTPFPIPEYHR
ncbi:hypothetical protein BV22DRAFT_1041260 [Leucogyrophana mollusca]|uniref:Uncharacterized protein n=1 Tax=Leucogyrophana mollusca TaxID=85980 RepID=A0ACB8AZN8_9AGAM|nr:hypothetical protein BV22DRAFT_1041260 [Leucogyrophana mollusca]